MKVSQYIYLGDDSTDSSNERINTLTVGTPISFAQNYAYRIAFQALPGTLFTLKAGATSDSIYPNDKSIITMGPTGIYEIGYTQPLIPQFLVLKIIDKNSPMILDVLQSESVDRENITTVTNYLSNLLEEEDYGGTNI